VRVAVNVAYMGTCTGLMLVIARRLARPELAMDIALRGRRSGSVAATGVDQSDR
jgi:hypothetical protein